MGCSRKSHTEREVVVGLFTAVRNKERLKGAEYMDNPVDTQTPFAPMLSRHFESKFEKCTKNKR